MKQVCTRRSMVPCCKSWSGDSRIPYGEPCLVCSSKRHLGQREGWGMQRAPRHHNNGGVTCTWCFSSVRFPSVSHYHDAHGPSKIEKNYIYIYIILSSPWVAFRVHACCVMREQSACVWVVCEDMEILSRPDNVHHKINIRCEWMRLKNHIQYVKHCYRRLRGEEQTAFLLKGKSVWWFGPSTADTLIIKWELRCNP
jgi:hypothetical protein